MPEYAEMSWEDLKTHVAAGRLELFGREKKGEEFYQESCNKLREEYGSVTAYLQKVILAPLHKEIEEFGDSVPLENTEPNGKGGTPETRPRVIFVKNDYPYYLKKPIKHHLIWSLVEWSDQTAVQKFLDFHLPAHHHIYFENPIHLKSVKDIYHIHVFSLPHDGTQ